MSLIQVLWTRMLILAGGVAAIGRISGILFRSLFGTGGTFAARVQDRLTSPEGLRLVFDAMRTFAPNLALNKKLITAYDNIGTVLVTRFDDVKDVLARDQEFEVVYRPRMVELTGGNNFFLGMQNTPDYTRDVSNMRLAVRRDDLPGIIRPFVSDTASRLVQASAGRLDAPQELTLQVPAMLLAPYFGTPGPSAQIMIGWTTILFWYLFVDLQADPAIGKRALTAGAELRTYLDSAIAARKAKPNDADDVLNRCLAMQKAGLPGMTDLDIRNNFIGLLIGLVPTTSSAATRVLDQLLDRPAALAGAQQAARDGDDALLAAYVFEALRFNPHNPVIYRRATRDTVVAPNTARATKVPKGSMVVAANLSAMFDPLRLGNPNAFRADRPWSDYILWGDGMHTCFGAYINQVTIPGLLKPLLRQRGLRRAAGRPGQIDTDGTPFPVHMRVEFDAG